MILNEVARQTGVYTQTLRRKAIKLFGRSKGEFTDDEVDAILASLCLKIKDPQVPENKLDPQVPENKLDPQLIVSIDRLLQFKIPHWGDYDKHLAVLSKLLHEVSKKGAEQYERDLIEAQQLAEEYNQWLDEQIENDDFGGFRERIAKDVEALHD